MRTGIRAVDVHLVTDAQGRLAIADVPEAAAVEASGVGPGWATGGVPPADIITRGSALAAELGVDPTLEVAGQADGVWRLVFSIGDASGLRFPIAVRIEP